jgi:exosortase/archaeosortase family protein
MYPMRRGVRFLLLVCSPIVAIGSNVVRLVPTVYMFGHYSLDTAERFHNISGWVMTIVAFLFLMGLTEFFRRLWEAVAAIELSPSEADSAGFPAGMNASA